MFVWGNIQNMHFNVRKSPQVEDDDDDDDWKYCQQAPRICKSCQLQYTPDLIDDVSSIHFNLEDLEGRFPARSLFWGTYCSRV